MDEPQKRQDVSDFALTYSLRLRSCKSLDAFIISSLPSRLKETLQAAGSLAPWALLHFLATKTHPPPSRLRSVSRFSRLYDLPCSGDFAPGRGGLCQLLGMPLLPCCRFHPAEVEMPHRSDFGTPCCLRPTEAGSALGSTPFGATFTFTVVTARQLVVSPRETLSIGFRILISLHPAIQTTGRLTFAPAGLPPAEHTSLNWTHFRTAGFPRYGWKAGFSDGPFPASTRA